MKELNYKVSFCFVLAGRKVICLFLRGFTGKNNAEIAFCYQVTNSCIPPHHHKASMSFVSYRNQLILMVSDSHMISFIANVIIKLTFQQGLIVYAFLTMHFLHNRKILFSLT